PVTQHTKRFIRCFWALDRELANARHYPAIGWIDSYSEYAEEVKGWWDRLDPRWAEIRLKALDLLKKEQRLQQIVRLIGADALPESDRLILTVAEMIKNGFLQQNAFDNIDQYSVPEKQIQLLMLIMNFYELALKAIKAGCPLLRIIEVPVRSEIVRAKSVIANDDIDGLTTIHNHLEEQMGDLERLYRTSSENL
ncbi:MAG: V-type ATP synthase subunit A, partial [Treponema sp.]|nr:V-type ATP synthase subunit A [Treponema sp.]